MNVPFKRGQMVRLCDREGRYTKFLLGHRLMDAIAAQDGISGTADMIKFADPVSRELFYAPSFCVFFVYLYRHNTPIHGTENT